MFDTIAMKQILLIVAFLVSNCLFLSSKHRLVEVAPAYSSTSVNTTIFRTNSLVTRGDFQYIGFYDADGSVVVGKRTLGSTQWTLSKTPYRGNVQDAHNGISLMVDGAGYLHVSFDHHGHALRYAKGLAPGSLQLGSLQSMIGSEEQDVTYPQFYALPNGDLLFSYRSGASGRGNLVLNRYDVAEARWLRVQDVLLDGEGKRNAYAQLCVDDQGVIHVSWVWRETWKVETNHDLCYARSADLGKTWQRSDGSAYVLPIRAAEAEYAWRIDPGHELINQTSMYADADGNPYIATYWRDTASDVPQYRLVWHDGNRWNQQPVGHRNEAFSLSGGGTKRIPISRPQLVMDAQRLYYIFRDIERGDRVSIALSTNLSSGAWRIFDATDFSVEAWEPSLDTELWRREKQLHLFVQRTAQGDGEKTVDLEPQPVYVLECDLSSYDR